MMKGKTNKEKRNDRENCVVGWSSKSYWMKNKTLFTTYINPNQNLESNPY